MKISLDNYCHPERSQRRHGEKDFDFAQPGNLKRTFKNRKLRTNKFL